MRRSSPLTGNVFTQWVSPTDRSSPVWLPALSATALVPYSKLPLHMDSGSPFLGPDTSHLPFAERPCSSSWSSGVPHCVPFVPSAWFPALPPRSCSAGTVSCLCLSSSTSTRQALLKDVLMFLGLPLCPGTLLPCSSPKPGCQFLTPSAWMPSLPSLGSEPQPSLPSLSQAYPSCSARALTVMPECGPPSLCLRSQPCYPFLTHIRSMPALLHLMDRELNFSGEVEKGSEMLLT